MSVEQGISRPAENRRKASDGDINKMYKKMAR